MLTTTSLAAVALATFCVVLLAALTITGRRLCRVRVDESAYEAVVAERLAERRSRRASAQVGQ